MNTERSFDDLLDDFIKQELEKDMNGSADNMVGQPLCEIMSDLVPYTSNGTIYYVPVACDPQYYFNRLTICFKNEELASDGEQKSLVLKDKIIGENQLLMQLEDIFLKYEGLSKTNEVSLYLYRVGKSEPVKVCKRWISESIDSISYDSIEGDFSEIEGGWIPGEYFVLVQNAVCTEDASESNWDTFHSHMRYSFRVVPSGHSLAHPSIKRVSLSSDKCLEVILDGKTGKLDDFRFLMYNEDWVAMADTQTIKPYRNKLKEYLFSSSPWLDGDYQIVMLHNEEPCFLITFKWAENKLVDCSWEVLDMDSPYYMMAKYMRKDTEWNYLCRIPGCRSIRRTVVERYGYNVLNDWRDEHDMRKIVKDTHVSVALVNGGYESDLAINFAKLLNPSMYFRVTNCERVVENKNVVDPYEDMREAVSDCGRTVLCLHHLSALSSGTNGKVFLHMLEEALMTTPHMILMLMGTQAEISQVMEDSPFIARLIRPENRFHTERYSVREQIKFLENFLLEMEVNLTSQAEAKLAELLVSNQEMVSSWRKEELTQWWAQEICPRFMNRLLKNGEGDGSKKVLYNLDPEDICLPLNAAPKDEFEESVRELNAMVGLDNLKQNMKTLFNRSRFDKMRREAGLKVPEKGGYHMIFTGNPGTGKTTVAKLVGQVYHSLGLLSKGGVIVTERTKLVGRYLGETEKNMAAVLEQAKGNVLFIDEAYTLCDNDRGDRRDFGCRVLERLLTVLAQKNPDMIVIMAGYEKEMNQMLEMNPGMKGRFPYKFKFEDYNADELFQIANALLAKSEYVLTPMAELRLKETIEEVLLNKDAFFHNARWVEQYILDGVVSAMSDRLMSLPFHLQSRELLQTIEVQDIEMAYQNMKPQPLAVTAPRKRIGFVA